MTCLSGAGTTDLCCLLSILLPSSFHCAQAAQIATLERCRSHIALHFATAVHGCLMMWAAPLVVSITQGPTKVHKCAQGAAYTPWHPGLLSRSRAGRHRARDSLSLAKFLHRTAVYQSSCTSVTGNEDATCGICLSRHHQGHVPH